MSNVLTSSGAKERVISFVWQHVLLAASLFVMTLGVALCVRSAMGSSVISTIPYVMSLAGSEGSVPALTIGQYTYCMNFLLVGLQILVLRRRFEPVQLFQLVIGFAFGFLLDINMLLTRSVACEAVWQQTAVQLLGCAVLAVGISFELKCGSVTMPGEGLPVALSRAFNRPFAKMKIAVDISLVAIAVALGYLFFGCWLWNVVGPGTLLAMVLVGFLVKILSPLLGWFDSVVAYRPGFCRYIYGLAKFIYKHD